MDKKANEALGFIIETVKQGASFVQAQAPLYVQELLKYGAWEAKMWMIASVILILLAIMLIALGIYFTRASYSGDGGGPLVFIGIVVLCFGSVFLMKSISDLKMIELAPRVYVLENLREGH